MTVRLAVANENRTALDFEDSRVGDGNSEDVGGEVFETCFAGANGLGVDVPVNLPDLRRDLIEESNLLDFITELGSKDHGEGSDGEIEVNPGGVPEAIRGGEGAAWDDVVYVGVILQGTSPGMEDSEETWKISTDVIWIQGEFLDGLGGGLEQGRVS